MTDLSSTPLNQTLLHAHDAKMFASTEPHSNNPSRGHQARTISCARPLIPHSGKQENPLQLMHTVCVFVTFAKN